MGWSVYPKNFEKPEEADEWVNVMKAKRLAEFGNTNIFDILEREHSDNFRDRVLINNLYDWMDVYFEMINQQTNQQTKKAAQKRKDRK